MKYVGNKTHESIKAAIGAYAWPGGYPVYLVMADGGALCPECLRSNLRLILRATHGHHATEWAAEGAVINWEDAALTCDNCGQRIEVAYGEDE